MSAREAILARVRRQTEGKSDPEAVKARLGRPGQTALVPGLSLSEGAARVDQFIAKAQAADATISRVASLEDLPKALAEELRDRNLPAEIRTGDDRAFDRDWGTVTRSTGPGRLDEPATLSRAQLGSAETGTLLLASGRENPVTLTFLGETHFVVIDAADIASGFEEMWARWRESGKDPRTVNLVTGPSRSADIGQTLQLGAHGPTALHVFVVGNA